jgi:UDP-N-acetylmuramyl pentapeptide phosphotransferase/UDP-N-acetylglucosamine-1-phosphate transferase
MLVLVAALFSALATFLLVRFSYLHSAVTLDVPVGPQKFHTHSVSRIGGVAIIAGFVASIAAAGLFAGGPEGAAFARHAGWILACAMPAFGMGFAEDLTKRVGVGARLAATMLAAGIAYFVVDGVLDHVDVAGLDWALTRGWIASLVFTMVAVGGIANAINIVDGYNGLASVTSIFIFAALAYVSWSVGDDRLMRVSLAMGGTIAGFLAWNFPRGAIFLGDGGAYFIGFMIGETSVLLVRHHPEVSPWFPLMLVAYPVWETLFSIYRKKLVRGQSPGDADGLHFHQLVYKRVMRWKVGSKDPIDRLERNSLTSPYLWAFSLTTIVPAMLFWGNSVVLGFSAFTFAFFYVWLYRRMVGFRVPKWLIVRRPRATTPLLDWEESGSRGRT